ncbi:diaminobutyrate acetyltransferase [Pseudogracilibacillus sp. SO10305]|uniref:diaminobutyrate acetyltransferase n=1 Tax=Pseudogracilibacillus sp. SO10305 TaxID=3098292 RepID=UPI00300E204F
MELKSGELVHFRNPTEDDGSEMFRIVEESKVLDVNSPYSYLMWSKFFSNTSIVAETEDGEIIGFVSGFIQPEAPDTFFVWQVAVDSTYRGNGLATKLIHRILSQLKETEDVKYLEATVTPSNIPSSSLFRGMAKKYRANCAIFDCFTEEQFPTDDHEKELTYRIGPIQ